MVVWFLARPQRNHSDQPTTDAMEVQGLRWGCEVRQFQVIGDIHVGGQGVRTKFSHPYNYDPIVQWRNGTKPNHTVYTDRLYQWDSKKYNELCRKHFGDEAQYWDLHKRPVERIQDFLRDYLAKPDLVLCIVTEHCNQASGFPLWRLDYFN